MIKIKAKDQSQPHNDIHIGFNDVAQVTVYEDNYYTITYAIQIDCHNGQSVTCLYETADTILKDAIELLKSKYTKEEVSLTPQAFYGLPKIGEDDSD